MASISSPGGDGDGAPGDDGDREVDPAEAMADYAACMRENGIDMPDPEVVTSDDGEGGNVIVRGPAVISGRVEGPGADPGEDPGGEDPGGEGAGPRFRVADEEFQEAQQECGPLLEDAFGDIEIDPAQQAEMREQMLEFSQCMRDQGIDYPDPTFGEDGSVQIAIEAGEGLDPASDEFTAAMEECGSMFSGPGGGPGTGGFGIQVSGAED